MKILAIETSCDETALSFLDIEGDIKNLKIKIVANVLNSQIEIHKKYGGVYPSLAKREHAKNLIPLFDKLLDESGQKINKKEKHTDDLKMKECEKILEREPGLFEAFKDFIPTIKKPNFDIIVVTSGPGLEPALWVGINFAKSLSLYFNIPLLPINHMEGHVFSILKGKDENKTVEARFPAIALLISGGHTQLVFVKNFGDYKIIGETKDDAVGEAFDKVARILNLPYPGGPEISRLAQIAREKNLKPNFELPRPMINSKDLNFSFSGLKTAVLYLVQKIKETGGGNLDEDTKQKIAREFEDAVTEVLFKKTAEALKQTGAENLFIGGGVISNQHLRNRFENLKKEKINVFFPEKELSTDNAIMIGIVGFLKSQKINPEINPEISADGNLRL